MPTLSRRRFLSLSAGLTAGLALRPAMAADLYEWRGIALGAEARILIAHPQAAEITAEAVAEIARLEQIFSLYRPDSALMRLNASSTLDAPPFELLECLALCNRAHTATAGRFDPTVQPLWTLYASHLAAGTTPTPADLTATMANTGWQGVSYGSEKITLRPGMALTLNGIAQGFIADQIATLFRAKGLTDILINTGEFHALGGQPGGGAWPVHLTSGSQVALQDRALASSSPRGTLLDAAGKIGHIFDPATGQPAPATWQLVTLSAPTAAVADALSTAACLMQTRAEIETAIRDFDGARIESLV